MNATLQAHRIETTIQQDGTLTLDHLPFPVGESVEVIILRRPARTEGQNPYPLRGARVRYDDPLDPVGEEDWNAGQ